MPTNYSDRMARVRAALARERVDALILTPGANLFYLTGFEHGHAYERLLALVVRADGSSRWVIPTMNTEQVRPHLGPGQELRPWDDAEGYLPALRDSIAGARTIAFDDDARAAFALDLLSVAPGARIVKASSIMRPLRIRKDATELASLRQAAGVVDQTIPFAISLCKPGTSEAQVESDLRAALLKRDPTATVPFCIIARRRAERYSRATSSSLTSARATPRATTATSPSPAAWDSLPIPTCARSTTSSTAPSVPRSMQSVRASPANRSTARRERSSRTRDTARISSTARDTDWACRVTNPRSWWAATRNCSKREWSSASNRVSTSRGDLESDWK